MSWDKPLLHKALRREASEKIVRERISPWLRGSGEAAAFRQSVSQFDLYVPGGFQKPSDVTVPVLAETLVGRGLKADWKSLEGFVSASAHTFTFPPDTGTEVGREVGNGVPSFRGASHFTFTLDLKGKS